MINLLLDDTKTCTMRTYLLSFFCLAYSIFNTTTAQSNSNTAAFGIVVEKSTGEPMEFVDVVLYEHEGETFLDGVTTNGKGEFRWMVYTYLLPR